MATKRESKPKKWEEISFEELIAQAGSLVEEEGADGGGYWKIVEVLGKRGDRETLDKTLALTQGHDECERDLAVSILGRMGEENSEFSSEITARLLEMLAVETDQDWLANIVAALGNQKVQPRIFEALKPFAAHSYAWMRWNVTMAISDWKTEEATELLIQLTADADELVRDWATFALNNRDNLDTPAVRAAFVARLEDEDAHTRAEALYGLAQLHDSRVVAAVRQELNRHPNLWDSIDDSPDYRLLPALRAMSESPGYLGNQEELQSAIAACEAQAKQNEN